MASSTTIATSLSRATRGASADMARGDMGDMGGMEDMEDMEDMEEKGEREEKEAMDAMEAQSKAMPRSQPRHLRLAATPARPRPVSSGG